MGSAPSPHGLPRIEGLGDSTAVFFRSRRDVGFLAVWLVAWTVGGIAAIEALVHAPLAGRLFLSFWLCGWIAGEAVVGGIVAWRLFGGETADRQLGRARRASRGGSGLGRRFSSRPPSSLSSWCLRCRGTTIANAERDHAAAMTRHALNGASGKPRSLGAYRSSPPDDLRPNDQPLGGVLCSPENPPPT